MMETPLHSLQTPAELERCIVDLNHRLLAMSNQLMRERENRGRLVLWVRLRSWDYRLLRRKQDKEAGR